MVEIEVFECQSGTSKAGRAYNIVLARLDGRVGKIFSDVRIEAGKHLVEVGLAPNQEMFLSPRIKSVKSGKE